MTTSAVHIEPTGIVHTVKIAAAPHTCNAPNARDYGRGSLYCCPECHRISICDLAAYSDYQWDLNVWKLETEKERRKRWKRGVIYKGELR